MKKIKNVIANLAFFSAIGLIVYVLIIFPAIVDRFDGSNRLIQVQYTWVSPYEVEIGPTFDSAIPYGYSLYLYTTEPVDRTENSYGIPKDAVWEYKDYTQDWKGKIIYETAAGFADRCNKFTKPTTPS